MRRSARPKTSTGSTADGTTDERIEEWGTFQRRLFQLIGLAFSKKQEADATNFVDEDGVELEVVEKEELVEWLGSNYKNFGATLEFVSDKSQEGTQFVKGFGGIGGILRYKVDFLEDDFEGVGLG